MWQAASEATNSSSGSTALASDKALASVIDSALALLALPPGANQHITDEVDRAHQALNERLFELKLSHIDGAKE